MEGVSFTVERGQYVSLVGQNGAGKSTLLRCALGVLPLSSGAVYLNGRPLAELSSKQIARRMAYVPQNGQSVYPHEVFEFVMMGRFPHLGFLQSPGKKDEDVVLRALELTGTRELCGRSLAHLSGGERQRVVIAAALAQNPHVLLLDEVCHFLDPLHESEVHHLLEKLHREEKVSILSVTHDVNRAALHSEKIVALGKGAVIFDGTVDAFMQPDVLRRVYEKDFVMLPHPERAVRVVLPDVAETSSDYVQREPSGPEQMAGPGRGVPGPSRGEVP